MADEQTDLNSSTKVQAAPVVEAPSENMDAAAEQAILEEIDAVIGQIDPKFHEQMATIGPNEEMRKRIAEGFSLDLDDHGPGRDLTFKEKLRALPFLIVDSTKTYLINKKEKTSESLRAFKYFRASKKISIITMIVLFIASGFIGYKAVTKGLFPPEEELFVTTLKDWAQESYVYEPNETEYLYESTHSSRNIMEISRMVVNIRRSSSSGENPMAAFEFYVEGNASDVMVEVKDREAEVKDLLQRNIEDLNFDQISSGEGKQLLCEKLRKEVNKILTKGKIRRFFIKTAIVKP